MGAVQSADQPPPAGQALPEWLQGPWKPDEFLAERVECGRRLLEDSEEHRGDADLQVCRRLLTACCCRLPTAAGPPPLAHRRLH